MALVANGLHALVCSNVTGMRRSVEREWSVRKSSAMTVSVILVLKSSVLVQAQYWSQLVSSTFAGAPGILLEWHRAQYWANAILPRVNKALSLVKYCSPPGASWSRSGFPVLRKNNATSA